MDTHLIFFTLAVYLNSISAQSNFGCSPEYCWERCLSAPDAKCIPDFREIANYLLELRNLRIQYNSTGLAFLLDRTIEGNDDNIMAYETALAAMASIVTPVRNGCIGGSGFGTGYNDCTAGRVHVAQCADTCDAAAVLASTGPLEKKNHDLDKLSAGCSTLNYFRSLDLYPCHQEGERELMVSFVNSKQEQLSANPSLNDCLNFKNRLVVDVGIEGCDFVPSYLPSHPTLKFKLSYNSQRFNAAVRMLNCMSLSCCGRSYSQLLTDGPEFLENNGIFGTQNLSGELKKTAYATADNPKMIKQSDLPFDALARTMECFSK